MIETLFSYRDVPTVSGTILVVDILRASSVIVTALQHGACFVKTVRTIKEAKNLKKEGYIICGERNTKKIKGFDKGNSPFEFFDVENKKIVITTSNGTKTVEKARKYSSKILVGAFLNLDSIFDYIKDDENIVIWCAGNNGEISYEDTLFAGALVKKLYEYGRKDLSDSSLVSMDFWSGSRLDFKGKHAEKLIQAGFEKDVEFCKQNSIYNVIPRMVQEAFYGVKLC
ncbi:2-phosphosulfolactate phosphatase [Thermosipho atlanticus]|uniref:Probable 2-phosphosulfolactate phosphatase n=1 Tax=Thermosipho atlanticus DSM 15807 TaxID=1123380 RepID=A0A1M5T4Y9_9BACT|nr:2-phosphosulfolactate phosphatase [Thermosipho atlanticus]SHH45766.1 2-phosphosulfolactate phosphatase [Thermosipho atlanticus DSM 15807]